MKGLYDFLKEGDNIFEKTYTWGYEVLKAPEGGPGTATLKSTIKGIPGVRLVTFPSAYMGHTSVRITANSREALSKALTILQDYGYIDSVADGMRSVTSEAEYDAHQPADVAAGKEVASQSAEFHKAHEQVFGSSSGGAQDVQETGEMGHGDITQGGEDYEWAKAIEEDVKEIEKITKGKLKFEGMKPFDKYRGPYAATSLGRIWDAGVEGEKYLFMENSNWVGTAQELAQAINGDATARALVVNQAKTAAGEPTEPDFNPAQMKFPFAESCVKSIKEADIDKYTKHEEYTPEEFDKRGFYLSDDQKKTVETAKAEGKKLLASISYLPFGNYLMHLSIIEGKVPNPKDTEDKQRQDMTEALDPRIPDQAIDFRYISGTKTFKNGTKEYNLLNALEDKAWEDYLDVMAGSGTTVEYDLVRDVFTASNVVGESTKRSKSAKVLREQKINEQEPPPEPAPETGAEIPEEPTLEEPPAEPPKEEKPKEEEEPKKEEPVKEKPSYTKEYFGSKGTDKHYYFIHKMTEDGMTVDDLQVLDIEDNIVFSAKEKQMDVLGERAFLKAAAEATGIDMIAYDVVMRYKMLEEEPPLEEKPEDEVPELKPKEEEKPEQKSEPEVGPKSEEEAPPKESFKRPAKQKIEEGYEQIGSGKLPNKYYVTGSGDYYMMVKRGTLDWASEQLKDFKPKSKKYGVFNTYKEATAAVDTASASEFGSEPNPAGINTITVEDHLTGELLHYGFVAYKQAGYRYEIEQFGDTKFTAEKMKQAGQTFETGDSPGPEKCVKCGVHIGTKVAQNFGGKCPECWEEDEKAAGKMDEAKLPKVVLADLKKLMSEPYDEIAHKLDVSHETVKALLQALMVHAEGEKESIYDKKLKEGTWATPNTQAKKQALLAFLDGLDEGELEPLEDFLYSKLGDDELFDELEDIVKPVCKPIAKAIRKKLKDLNIVIESSMDETVKLRKMTDDDRMGFAGAEGEAMIGDIHTSEGAGIVIVDQAGIAIIIGDEKPIEFHKEMVFDDGIRLVQAFKEPISIDSLKAMGFVNITESKKESKKMKNLKEADAVPEKGDNPETTIPVSGTKTPEKEPKKEEQPTTQEKPVEVGEPQNQVTELKDKEEVKDKVKEAKEKDIKDKITEIFKFLDEEWSKFPTKAEAIAKLTTKFGIGEDMARATLGVAEYYNGKLDDGTPVAEPVAPAPALTPEPPPVAPAPVAMEAKLPDLSKQEDDIKKALLEKHLGKKVDEDKDKEAKEKEEKEKKEKEEKEKKEKEAKEKKKVKEDVQEDVNINVTTDKQDIQVTAVEDGGVHTTVVDKATGAETAAVAPAPEVPAVEAPAPVEEEPVAIECEESIHKFMKSFGNRG